MNARSLFTVLLLCFAMAGIGQNNFTGFNYQAVVRNAIGDPLPNQAIAVRVQMNPTGSNGYTERHTVTTDANGQIKLVMGEGTPVVGSTVPTFAGLDWTSGAVMNYTVSVDITGGTTYTALGSGQFKSVPFALRSLTSGGSSVGWTQTGNNLSNTNSGNVGIGTNTPGAKLDVNGRARINGATVGRGFGTNDSTSTVLGVRSLASGSTSPRANTAIGYEAMASNTLGNTNWNTAVGYRALRTPSSNSYENNAFGYNSLTGNTTGVLNAAFGSTTMELNTTGNFNSAFGNWSLRLNTSGSENVGLGYRTLEATTTGGFNTACGARSLRGNSTGTNNTALGSLADVASGALTNATAIGANALATQSNTLVLGSINGVNSATADVNVGIGTNTPTQKLDVVSSGNAFVRTLTTNGTSQSGLIMSKANAGDWSLYPQPVNGVGNLMLDYAGSTKLFVEGSTGNVGIGTNIPSNKLTVQTVNGYGIVHTNGTTQVGTYVDDDYGWLGTSSPHPLAFFTDSGAPGVLLNTNGNLGVGSIDPQSRLSVNGGVAIGSTYSGTNTAPADGLLVEGSVGIGTPSLLSKLAVNGGVAVGSAYADAAAAPVNGAIIQGSVGIGTPTMAPATKLAVQGGAVIGGSYTALSYAAPEWGAIIEGNVGIGVNIPTARLDVRGASPTGNAALLTNGYVKFCTLPSNASGNVSIGTVNGYGNTKLTIQSDQTYALHSTNTAGGNAGYFQGNVAVTGTLSKGGGSFKIDHPLDPTNKFLYHSFVESPDMMNVYNGNVVLDGSGAATVALPDYFQALNKDYRYQLTPIGAPGPGLYVAQKVANGVFTIAGGTPGAEVSWQVTGIRQDAFANENRIPNTVDKKGVEVGKYLHPSAFGLDRSMGIDYRTNGE